VLELLTSFPQELKVAMGSLYFQLHFFSTFFSLIWVSGNHDERRESKGARQAKKLSGGVRQ
jgi:hypothetical protein